ncbi:MAG: DNA/RNA non-specific endonuclease [Streptococcaceae bacterium]|nr:DNA/RNA non-specific endonuclease [Streptococcaceae bacterium]
MRNLVTFPTRLPELMENTSALVRKGFGDVKNVIGAARETAGNLGTILEDSKVATEEVRNVSRMANTSAGNFQMNFEETVSKLDRGQTAHNFARNVKDDFKANIDGIAFKGSSGIPSTVKKNFVENPFNDDGSLKPNSKYKTSLDGTDHNYLYETDNKGRIEKVDADPLELKADSTRDRAPYDPNTPDKPEFFDAGHLIGDQFDGSGEINNLISQARNLNRGKWLTMENKWADALREGKDVKVSIQVRYEGESMRPSGFDVKYSIDGDYQSRSFDNVNPY